MKRKKKKSDCAHVSTILYLTVPYLEWYNSLGRVTFHWTKTLQNEDRTSNLTAFLNEQVIMEYYYKYSELLI